MADFAEGLAERPANQVRSGPSVQAAAIGAANTQALNEANSVGAKSEPSPESGGGALAQMPKRAPSFTLVRSELDLQIECKLELELET